MSEVTEEVNEEVEQVVEVDADPLGFLDDEKHPLANLVDNEPVTTAGKEVEKVEEVPETTTEPVKEEKPKDETTGLQAATDAERLKFELIEARRARQTAEAALNAKSVEEKEFNWEDPKETLTEMENRLKTQMQGQFLSMSESQCMSRHEDYGEKYNAFKDMAMVNPALINSMLQQPDPAEWAYKLATQKMFTDEVGADPQSFRDKIKAEVRLEMEEEYNKKISDRIDTAGALPPSAAKMTDKVAAKTATTDPMEDLFPGEVPGG